MYIIYLAAVVSRVLTKASSCRLLLRCPLPDHVPPVFVQVDRSVLVCDASILVSTASHLFCACLVSVQVSAYIIAGSTQELDTCHFRRMAKLLLKRSRCMAYAAQHSMILRCINLFVMVLFLEVVVSIQVYAACYLFI